MYLCCIFTATNLSFSELALSPNSNEVHVYGWMGSEARWSLLDRLREHVERVTGVDWAPVSNRIVTCGSVRTAAESANHNESELMGVEFVG